ncbi:hypothetical protein ACA910_016282 [Epithemia clementina (nom. ined.)]
MNHQLYYHHRDDDFYPGGGESRTKAAALLMRGASSARYEGGGGVYDLEMSSVAPSSATASALSTFLLNRNLPQQQRHQLYQQQHQQQPPPPQIWDRTSILAASTDAMFTTPTTLLGSDTNNRRSPFNRPGLSFRWPASTVSPTMTGAKSATAATSATLPPAATTTMATTPNTRTGAASSPSTTFTTLTTTTSTAGTSIGSHDKQNTTNQTSVPNHTQEEDLAQLPELRARVRRHVDAVIQSLPSTETAAYQQARQQQQPSNGDLVQEDSDPLHFVRYCQYNVVAAAHRLCLYWTERLALFGPERAFLPLTLTGTGALTPEDLLSLRAGFPVLLPENATTTGHPCMLVDRRKRVGTATKQSIFRCFFYLYKILAQNDLAQGDGAKVLVVSVTPRTKGFNADMVGGLAAFTNRIFPVKLQFHLLVIPNQLKQQFAADLVQALMTVLRQHMTVLCTSPPSSSTVASESSEGSASVSCLKNIKIHVESQPNQILRELLDLGWTKHGVPFFLGGEWKFEDFSDWCEERIEWEQVHYKKQLMTLSQQGCPKNGGSGGAGETNGDSSNGGVVVVAWSKFNRRNVPATVSSTSASKSVTSSSTNGAAANASQGSVPPVIVGPSNSPTTPADCKTVVAAASSTTDKTKRPALTKEERVAKRKMADMLYSRRKREREHVREQQLKEQSTRLSQEKEVLLVEQQRLHRLLQQAQEYVSSSTS